MAKVLANRRFEPLRLRAVRQALGWTRAELADRLDVSRQLVWSWEQGIHVPSSPVLVRLADLTDTPLDRFFQPERPERPTPRRRGSAAPAPEGESV